MIAFAPAHLYLPARDIVQRLHNAGHEAYIAGGAVRDHLLQRPQSDLDIATSARPEEVRALFPRTIAVGESFGVLIVLHQGQSFEVASFREESDYQDGRHPGQVSFSSARADVARRDFTINGMLWDPIREELLDWVNGQADVRAGLIRTIGPAEDRFREDRLRMLRAIRFAAQLDFALDPQTLQGIPSLAEGLNLVSTERIRQELDKLLAGPAAHRALGLLDQSGLAVVLSSRLRREAEAFSRRHSPQFGNRVGWPCTESWLKIRSALPQSGLPSFPVLVCLMLDMAGLPLHTFMPRDARNLGQTLEALTRGLRGSRAETASAYNMGWILAHINGFASLRLADQLRLLRLAEAPWALAVARMHPDFTACPMNQIDQVVVRHSESWWPKSWLGGHQLIELGVPSGPTIGHVMDELESLQLELRLPDAAAAEQQVRAWLECGTLPGDAT